MRITPTFRVGAPGIADGYGLPRAWQTLVRAQVLEPGLTSERRVWGMRSDVRARSTIGASAGSCETLGWTSARRG
jgi:hypothetical protein